MADIPQKSKEITTLEALGFVWDVLLSVAVPTTFFALAGRYADKHWNMGPYGTILGLILACVVVAALIIKKAHKIAERLQTPRV